MSLAQRQRRAVGSRQDQEVRGRRQVAMRDVVNRAPHQAPVCIGSLQQRGQACDGTVMCTGRVTARNRGALAQEQCGVGL